MRKGPCVNRSPKQHARAQEHRRSGSNLFYMTRSPMSRKEIHMDERTLLIQAIAQLTTEQWAWFRDEATKLLADKFMKNEKEVSRVG